MSKIRLMLAALVCAFTAFAAPEIQFLPYFDSLNAYRGRAGHWFVSDAAGTSTGQHGDPTVFKGWAMYTWNPNKTGGAGWTKICEEESLDSSVAESLLRDYVTRKDFNAAMETISKTYTTLDKHNADVTALRNICSSLNVTVQTMQSEFTDMKSDVAKVITVVKKVKNDLAAHELWANNASNNVLTSAMKYTDEKCKGAGMTTNDVISIASGLDITVKSDLRSDIGVASNNVVAIAADDATTKSAAAKESANEYTDDATNEVLIAANKYTDEKCTGIDTNAVKAIAGELDAALSNNLVEISTDLATAAKTGAMEYTDSTAESLRGDIAASNAVTLAEAKIYADGTADAKDLVLSNRLDTAAKGYASSALTSAKNYTDSTVQTINKKIEDGDAATLTAAAADATSKANVAEYNAKTNAAENLDVAVGIIDGQIDALDTRVGSIEGKISGVYHFKGSCLYAELPTTGQQEGDVWYCTDKSASYAWSASKNEWYSLGGGMDLSAYKVWDKTKTYIDTADETLQANIEGVAEEVDKKYAAAIAYTDGRVGPFKNDGRQVTIGGGASNTTDAAAINICSYTNYPSFVYGMYNICLGIDNIVGDYEGTLVGGKPYKASYAVAVGTSARASKMHSYAWGSQINALAANSTVMGYGLSATDEYSVVIGQASRTINDKYFTNETAMVEFLSDPNCTNTIFVGFGILAGNGPGCSHIVEEVLTLPDPETGLYARLRKDPLDIEVGKRKWFYGKSHGRGTVTLAAIGNGVNDYGLANVFINDRSLADLTGVNVGQPTDKEVYNKGIFGPTKSHCDHDYTIAIGDNAKAVETASSCQAIAIGRDALSAGSATVAVGPNAFAFGALSSALGWRANAVGEHAIAIGSAKKSGENYFKDGDINPNSDLCQAVGADSIAIGFNTKAQNNKSVAVGYYAAAKADGAVQIGIGTNTTANSLRFQNVDIVKDGKVCGTFNPSDLDPKKIDVTQAATIEEMVVTAMPHVVNTIVTSAPTGPGTELYLEPKGSRNYDVFIPNTEEFRAGLPFGFDSEVKDAETIFTDDKKNGYRLPMLIKVQQPHESVIMFTVKEIKDKTDWTPAITDCNIVFTNNTKFVTQGTKSLVGTNLHAAVEYKIAYPSASGVVTNDLQTMSANASFLNGTFYNYASSVEYSPNPQIVFTGDTSWFKIIYKTVNGVANEITKTIKLDLE